MAEAENVLLNAVMDILQEHLDEPIAQFLNFDEDDNDDDDDDDDSSSDDELPILHADVEQHVRYRNYVVDVVYFLSDRDFRSHFRLSRTGVEELYMELREDFIQTTGRPSVPMTHALLLSIWALATPESFRSVADRFGLDRGHAHVLCMRIWQKMYDKSHIWIRWPRGAEAVRCVEDFNSLGFPGVFGVVDGSYIPIPGPLIDASYYNRKGFHSVTLQGVCDSHMRFIDVFCGFPSSAHDARVWANSPIGRALAANHEAHLPQGCHLLADKAYPCRVYIIPPFKDDGHMTPQRIRFNTKLSSVRVIIENTFGRLKGIFRRMKDLDVQNLYYVKFYIVAACILHNMVINERFELGDLVFDMEDEDDEDDDDEEDDDDDDDDDGVAPEVVAPDAVARETGPEKRIRLMNLIVPDE